MTTVCGRSVVILACTLLAACAAEGGRVLHLDIQSSRTGKPVVWPAPPEVPRYAYAGELTGEANFRGKEDEAASTAKSFFRWVVGLVVGEKQPTVLQRPQTGAVDAAGRIYVTDASRQAVFVFDPQAGGLQVWDKADGLANFVSPVGIAVGRQGAIYVADAQLGIVATLDAQGNTQSSIGRGLLKRPTGLAYDARRGHLFVADTYAHVIRIFDTAGRLVGSIGQPGEADGELNYPTHLAFAHDQLYVTDTMNSRVQIFSGDTFAFKLKFGLRGLYVGNLVRPKGIAADGEGNIYVVESYYDHLLIYDRRGDFLMPIGSSGTASANLYLPAGVWVDEHNRVFVADMFNGRVVVLQFLGGDGAN